MILKSMNVECNKTDMDNYAGEVDEEESGKFTFNQFCSVRSEMDASIFTKFSASFSIKEKSRIS